MTDIPGPTAMRASSKSEVTAITGMGFDIEEKPPIYRSVISVIRSQNGKRRRLATLAAKCECRVSKLQISFQEGVALLATRVSLHTPTL